MTTKCDGDIRKEKSINDDVATLYDKLQEYEMELGRIEKHENIDKKYKNIALKVDSREVEKEDNPEKDENFMLLVKMLGKYFSTNEKF